MNLLWLLSHTGSTANQKITLWFCWFLSFLDYFSWIILIVADNLWRGKEMKFQTLVGSICSLLVRCQRRAVEFSCIVELNASLMRFSRLKIEFLYYFRRLQKELMSLTVCIFPFFKSMLVQKEFFRFLLSLFLNLELLGSILVSRELKL